MSKWIRNLQAWLGGEERCHARVVTQQDEIAAMVFFGDVYPVRVIEASAARNASTACSCRKKDTVWPFIR